MKHPILTAAFLFLGFTAFSQGPGHQNTHIKNHPRVNQVNGRIDNQEKRINQERRQGELSHKQAVQDRKNLKEINQEKHDMRKLDNGHLTKQDQRTLNKQLNQNSKEIGH